MELTSVSEMLGTMSTKLVDLDANLSSLNEVLTQQKGKDEMCTVMIEEILKIIGDKGSEFQPSLQPCTLCQTLQLQLKSTGEEKQQLEYLRPYISRLEEEVANSKKAVEESKKTLLPLQNEKLRNEGVVRSLELVITSLESQYQSLSKSKEQNDKHLQQLDQAVKKCVEENSKLSVINKHQVCLIKKKQEEMNELRREVSQLKQDLENRRITPAMW